MKNLNINTITYLENERDKRSIMPFDEIEVEQENGVMFIRNFNILICTNVIMSQKNDIDPNEYIVKDNTYDVWVTMNQVKNNKSIDVTKYKLMLNASNIHKMCREIYEEMRIVKFDKLVFPKTDGNQYAIKVFVKNEKDCDERWSLQTIQTFKIKSC